MPRDGFGFKTHRVRDYFLFSFFFFLSLSSVSFTGHSKRCNTTDFSLNIRCAGEQLITLYVAKANNFGARNYTVYESEKLNAKCFSETKADSLNIDLRANGMNRRSLKRELL